MALSLSECYITDLQRCVGVCVSGVARVLKHQYTHLHHRSPRFLDPPRPRLPGLVRLGLFSHCSLLVEPSIASQATSPSVKATDKKT